MRTRLDDLRGKKVATGTRMLVFPASGRIFQQALEHGYIQDFMKAGAVVMTVLVVRGLNAWNMVMGDVKEGEDFMEIEATGQQFN